MPVKKRRALGYASTGWSNVFRSGLKLWYRSALSGNKAISASTIEELTRELHKRGIRLEKRVQQRSGPAATPKARARKANASTAKGAKAKGKAKAKAKALPRRRKAGPSPEAAGQTVNKSVRPRRRISRKGRPAEPEALSYCCGICFRVSGFDLCPCPLSMSWWQAHEAGQDPVVPESVPAAEAELEPPDSITTVQMSQAAFVALSRNMALLQQMQVLVPSLAAQREISEAMARAVDGVAGAAEQVEEGQRAMLRAFLAVDAAAKLAGAAAMLIRAEMLPKVRICIRSSQRPSILAALLPRYQGWFSGMDLNVYVAEAEYTAYQQEFQQRGINVGTGVFLKQGGAGPGAQVQAALRETPLQDHRRAKLDLCLACHI